MEKIHDNVMVLFTSRRGQSYLDTNCERKHIFYGSVHTVRIDLRCSPADHHAVPLTSAPALRWMQTERFI